MMYESEWYDTHCGEKKRFICEIDTQALSSTTVPDDYKPNGWCPVGTIHFRDDCYSIFTRKEHQLTFSEARDYCRTVSGRDLASFGSIESLNYLLSNGQFHEI